MVSVYPASAAAAATAPAIVEVLITAAGFQPQYLDLIADQTVRWRNTTDGVH